MTALGNVQQLARAEDERRRAIRTATIAERHEKSEGGEPFLRAFHVRMATIHRQVQRQHLAAAALHAARARRVLAWLEAAGESVRPGKSAVRDDRAVSRPVDGRGDAERRPGRRGRVGPNGRSERRRAPAVAGSQLYAFLSMLVEALEVDGDVERFSSRFVAGCVALLDISAAAMLVTDPQGDLRIAACSSEPARLFTAAELGSGEGPTVHCQRTGGRGAYPTIAALATRWPHLAGTAAAAGIAAVYTLPLRRRDDAFGVLTLVDRRPDRLTGDMLQRLGLLTSAAVVGLVYQQGIDHHQRMIAQLQSALTSRIAIEQAKGMLAERLGIPVDAAFDLLRGHARGNSRNLHEVAAQIVDHSLDIASPGPSRAAPLPRPSPPAR